MGFELPVHPHAQASSYELPYYGKDRRRRVRPGRDVIAADATREKFSLSMIAASMSSSMLVFYLSLQTLSSIFFVALSAYRDRKRSQSYFNMVTALPRK